MILHPTGHDLFAPGQFAPAANLRRGFVGGHCALVGLDPEEQAGRARHWPGRPRPGGLVRGRGRPAVAPREAV